MVRTASDESSGLVLLIAQGWPGGKSVVQLPSSSLPPGTPLLAVNGPGAIPSEIVSSDRFGVLAPSRRLMGLTEVKFESSAQLVGGALLFTLDGRFMGALNATLAARSADSAPQLANTIADKGSLIFKGRSPIPTYGPGELTVAYTVSLDSLRTVIAGFKSPSHNVLRPFLGVVCKDAESGGAYVESVLPESPAERAGIRQGDLIFMIGQVPVHNQVGFAKAMLLQTAGADVNVVTLRHGKTLMQRVTLGQSKD